MLANPGPAQIGILLSLCALFGVCEGIAIPGRGNFRVDPNRVAVSFGEPLSVVCFEPFPAPKQTSRRCPAECPYMRFDPDRMCHFKCITKTWCTSAPNMPTSFADDEQGKCVLCGVPGCRKCISADRCAPGECEETFEMSKEGACIPRASHLWNGLYVLLASLILFVLIYLAVLHGRPKRNRILLKLAKQYRSYSKLRSDTAGHVLYPLTSLPADMFVCGVGVMLHFRYQVFWLLWSFVVFASTVFLSWRYDRFQASEAMALAPMHDQALQECANFDNKDMLMVNEVQASFTGLTVAIYVMTSIACIILAIRQRQKYREKDDEANTMGDYALYVDGMPLEPARDNIEEEYTEFFRHAWGPCVVGVSICWDYSGKEDKVVNMATSVLDDMDREFNNRFLTSEQIHELEKEQAADGELPKRQNCVSELRCVDNVFWGRSCVSEQGEAPRPSPRCSTSEAKDLCRNLFTTGAVFVVIKTEQEMMEILERASPLKFGKENTDLKVCRNAMEPMTVLWDGFSVSHSSRVRRTLMGIVLLCLVIAGWAVCFYGPYVYYIMSWHNIAGKSMGDPLTNTFLGLLTVPGNQLVYYMCGQIVAMSGFQSQDQAHAMNVCLYTFAVFVNIVIDLGLLLVMAHGYQQDSGVDASAAIHNPSLQHALFVQMVGYLYPGTLLAPYLLEPLTMNVGPYFLGKWLVRSAIKISRRDAEQCIACPQFDLLRYGDITINIMLVIVCFFLTSQALWWVFMWLFISLAVIYAWDHYRFFRQTQRVYFASELVEVCSQYISAFPCGLLAAASVFKWYGGREILESFEITKDTFRVDFRDINQNMWGMILLAFLGHVVVHTLLLTFLVPCFIPARAPSTVQYSKMASEHAASWFNANPVHCLRSAFLHKHDPPHVYQVLGKEYVHMQNPDIHSYYESALYEEEKHSMRSTLSPANWRANIEAEIARVRNVVHLPHAMKQAPDQGTAQQSEASPSSPTERM